MTSGTPSNPTTDVTTWWQQWKPRVVAMGAVAVFVFSAIGAVATFRSCEQDRRDAGEGQIRVLPPLKRDSRVIPPSQLTFVADEAEEVPIYEPLGPGLPTQVNLEMIDGKPRLIRKAVYTQSDRYRTPDRDRKYGALICLPLNFRGRVRRGAKNFSLTLRPPIVAEKGDYMNLEVAVINPRDVGWSYVGTLKVYYNDDDVVVVENVVVDVLAETPLPPEERFAMEEEEAGQ